MEGFFPIAFQSDSMRDLVPEKEIDMNNKDRFTVSSSSSANGTSLQGYFNISFQALRDAFGDPLEIVDGYKVSTEWMFRDNETNQTVTLYDYKETNLYSEELPSVEEFRSQSSYEWHIGAGNKNIANAFVAFLEEKFKS